MNAANEKYDNLEKLYNELKIHYSQTLLQGGESVLAPFVQNISMIESKKDQFSFSDRPHLIDKYEGSEK